MIRRQVFIKAVFWVAAALAAGGTLEAVRPRTAFPAGSNDVQETRNIVKTIHADLNGDGRSETVSLSVSPAGTFVLTVNDRSFSGEFHLEEDDVDLLDRQITLRVITIDQRDPCREIEFRYNGDRYDLQECLLFSYKDDALQRIHDFPINAQPVYAGGGIVLVEHWHEFWTKKDKYRIDRTTRMLKAVPQAFYYVGVEAGVLEMFPIYRGMDPSDIVANLRPGSTCIILVYDPRGWYLIKSESGLVGWAKDLRRLRLPFAG